jgi:hypothetical protein
MRIAYPSLRLLILELISKAARAGRKPALHPNGFVQLNLDGAGDIRLHVWSPRALPMPQQKTKHPIHDHNFDMHSTILRGCLRNYLYRAVPMERYGPPAYQLYRAIQISGTSDTVLHKIDSGKYHRLEITSTNDYELGESYDMSKGVLHQAVPHGLTATLVTKAQADASYRPIVAVPDGVQPDNDYRRTAATPESVQILWRLIGRAIE